jgi:hypothetical protein
MLRLQSIGLLAALLIGLLTPCLAAQCSSPISNCCVPQPSQECNGTVCICSGTGLTCSRNWRPAVTVHAACVGPGACCVDITQVDCAYWRRCSQTVQFCSTDEQCVPTQDRDLSMPDPMTVNSYYITEEICVPAECGAGDPGGPAD